MSNREKVIICIGTVGRPTFDKCYKTIVDNFSKHPNVFDIKIIENKSSKAEWLNEMRRLSADYNWCLQVDEDMYLYKTCLDELLKLAIANEHKKILNVSALLNDLFLMTKIGSIKLWSVKALQKFEFKNVLGSDREIAARGSAAGYENISIDKILGDHDSAPSEKIAYDKYYEYIQKMKTFYNEDAANKFISLLRKLNIRYKNKVSAAALSGATTAYNDLYVQNSKKTPIRNFDPLISIIMTNYNKEKYIEKSINSVLKQDYKNIELIIIDDASIDNSLKIIKNFTDERIKIYKTSVNYGTYACRNFGILNATGDFITFLDADDYIDKTHIMLKINKIYETGSKAVCTKYKRFNQIGKPVSDAKLCEASILFNKKIISDIGYFHQVRFGADTEFRKRIETFYGESSITLIEDLSYKATWSKNTLTSSPLTGQKSTAREIYVEQFLKNLKNKNSLKYNFGADMSFLKLEELSLVKNFSLNTFSVEKRINEE